MLEFEAHCGRLCLKTRAPPLSFAESVFDSLLCQVLDWAQEDTVLNMTDWISNSREGDR